MATSLGVHKGATIKTYSRRVSSNSEGPAAKRKRVEKSSDLVLSSPPKISKILSMDDGELSAKGKRDEESPSLVSSSRTNILKRSSIYNYFKPIQASSSPSSTQSLKDSSDPVEPRSTPPSSPPTKLPDSVLPRSVPHSQQAQKRPRRRLKSRPTLPSINDRSSTHSFAGQDAGDSDSDSCIIRGIPIPDDTIVVDTGQGQWETLVCPNAITSPTSIATHRGHRPERTRGFTQVQLDLGQRKFEQCKDCRFLWNPSISEEEERHKAVHTDWLFGKRSGLAPGHVLLDEYRDSDHSHIEIVDLHSPEKHKHQAVEILLTACEDMGGLCLTPEALWMQIPNPQHPCDPNLVPQYKVILYFVNRRSAAVLLVKRIKFGGPYYHGPIIFDEHGAVSPSEDSQTQEWVSEDKKVACWMSVDLLWVRTKYQRKGRATEMVDAARKCFIAGLWLKKKQIAFSRLTDKGVKFARKYCKDSGLGTDFLVDLGDAASVIRDGKLVRGSIS